MTRRPLQICCIPCITACIAIAVSRVSPAVEPQPSAANPAAKSLDEELLQGLDAKLSTGIDSKPSADSSQKPATKPTDRPDDSVKASKPTSDKSDKKPSEQESPAKKTSPLIDPLDEQLENSLRAGEDIGSPGEGRDNPLAKIVVRMRQVQQRLAENNSDKTTQQEQQRISDELKSLIEQLIQQQQQQKSSSSSPQQVSREKPKPGKAPPGKAPPGDPNKEPSKGSSPKVRNNHTDRPDPVATHELVIKELDRLNLPDKDRDEILQGAPDEFLPGHEASIEQYFRRLAEQDNERP